MDTNFDHELYSRVAFTLSPDAISAFRISRILFVGLGHLCIEIAKNVILSGVKLISLCDELELVSKSDIDAKMFFRPEHLNTSKAKTLSVLLSSMSDQCDVNVIQREDLISLLSSYSVVISSGSYWEYQFNLNNLCRTYNVKFISVETKGVFGAVFCDFGDQYTYFMGNNSAHNLIYNISPIENQTCITLVDESHNIMVGDMVVINGCNGMESLCDNNPKHVLSVKKNVIILKYTLSTENYMGGGYLERVSQKATTSFSTLQQFIQLPPTRMRQLKSDNPYLSYQVFLAFKNSKGLFNGEITKEQFLDLVNSECMITSVPENQELYLKFFKSFYVTYPPIVSIFGAIAANEVLKGCSNYLCPLQQSFFFGDLDVIPATNIDSLDNTSLEYLFGCEALKSLKTANIFMIGAGATGCELSKLFAQLGMCSEGKLCITDYDIIDNSNLSRQLLYKKSDVGGFKSKAACKSISELNSSVNAYPLTETVTEEEKGSLTKEFYSSLDIIITAVDNITAREIAEQKCIKYGIPMFDLGTEGLRGNFELFIPHKTILYSTNNVRDNNESIPVCTIHAYPSKMDHTVAWALEKWKEFEQIISSYWHLAALCPDFDKDKLATLQGKVSHILEFVPMTLEDCVALAYRKFVLFFNKEIEQLLLINPPSTEFWVGKRLPVPVSFTRTPRDIKFIKYTALILQECFCLKGEITSSFVTEVLKGISCDMTFTRKDNLHEVKMVSQLKFSAQYHSTSLKFIATCANIRAQSYGIPPSTRLEIQKVAGNIIPAIVTTTAVVSGFLINQIIKFFCAKLHKSDFPLQCGAISFGNNLSISLFSPEPPIPLNSNFLEIYPWTNWHVLYTDGNLTLQEFITKTELELQLKILSVLCNTKMLYGPFVHEPDMLYQSLQALVHGQLLVFAERESHEIILPPFYVNNK